MKECKICKKAIPIKRTYCSNQCKFSDNEYNTKRSPKLKNDANKVVRCLIDGKVIADQNNLGGHLSSYSKNFLNREFNWSDWEIIDKPEPDCIFWNCQYCDWKCKCDGIDKSGWIGVHLSKKHNISRERHCEKFPNDKSLWRKYWSCKERTELLSIEENRVECLECHNWFKKITNTHLLDCHNITMSQYKKKHPNAIVNSKKLTDRSRELYFSENGMSKVNPVSKGELEVKSYIEELGFSPIKYRTGFYEIDVYIPELKIGFEYHGLFHHSQFRGNHLKNRHIDTLNSIEKDGILLIQIFEDEWLYKNVIVKSRIKNILNKTSNKVFARKCEIKELSVKECKAFLLENHLQGYNNADIRIGLVFENQIVQCMTFCDINKRTNGLKIYDNGIYENVRSCIKCDWNVVGGFDRIFKYFEDKYSPKQVVSYADRRWSSMLRPPHYLKLGFDYIGITGGKFWVMDGYRKRMFRSQFTKIKMRKLNPTLFEKYEDSELTQERMIEMLGYDIIWDCGNLKFVKNYGNNIQVETFEDEDIDSDNIKKESRKRHINENVEIDESYVKCRICDEHYKIKGFSTHLGFQHKMKNFEYITQFGEYRPSHLNKNS